MITVKYHHTLRDVVRLSPVSGCVVPGSEYHGTCMYSEYNIYTVQVQLRKLHTTGELLMLVCI